MTSQQSRELTALRAGRQIMSEKHASFRSEQGSFTVTAKDQDDE
jgi:hypothetical protein